MAETGSSECPYRTKSDNTAQEQSMSIKNRRRIVKAVSCLIAFAVTISVPSYDPVQLSSDAYDRVSYNMGFDSKLSEEEISYYEEAVNDMLSVNTVMAASLTPPSLIKRLQAIWAKKSGKLYSVRAAAKRKSNTYGILQGSCTDGNKYVYFAFNRPSDDAVKVVKMRISFNELNPAKTRLTYVKATKRLRGIAHGNDMAYVKNAGGSGRDKILIITSESGGRDGAYIGMIDVKTMKEDGGKVYKYWKNLSEASEVAYAPDTNVKKRKRRTMESLVNDRHGYSTIAYNKKKDLVITTNKTDRDIMILRPVWKLTEGNTNVELKKLVLQRYIRQNKNNATSQGIDIDDNYIYTAWSPMSGKLSRNILQIYDYEGKHIGDKVVSGNYELEDIFHLGKGKNAKYFGVFYTSYYETYKVKVNKKWKKKTRFVRNSYMMYLGNTNKY